MREKTKKLIGQILIATLLLGSIGLGSYLNLSSRLGETPEAYYWLNLELKRPYGFRGESINLTAQTDYESVVIEFYLPNENLWKNQTWSANESRLINVPLVAPLGEYRIVGKVPNAYTTVWFTLVDSENFQATSFPYNKTHKDIQYNIFGNRTLRVSYQEQELSVHLPQLPAAVTVNCFNNSDIFVARFQSAVVDIDLSLVFVYEGAKLVINGTKETEGNFSFSFYSPRQIKNFFKRIQLTTNQVFGNNPDLFFDWGDFIKAKEHFSYNETTHILTVHNVPKTFRLDPTFGYTNAGASYNSMGNTIRGSVFTVLSGIVGIDVITHNITWYGRYRNVQTAAAKCMIHKASDLSFVAETEEIVGGSSVQWNTHDFASPVTLQSDTTYILTVWGESSQGRVYYDSGDTNQGVSQSLTYNTAPNPLDPTYDNNKYSIYAFFNSPIFADGFETGDYSGWDGTTGSPEVTSALSHHGTYSAKMNFTVAWQAKYCYEDYGNIYDDVYTRFYFRTDDRPADTKYRRIAHSYAKPSYGTAWYIDLFYSSPNYWIRLHYQEPSSGNLDFNFDYQVDTWYCFEVAYIQDASVGGYEIWIDGVSKASILNLDTTADDLYLLRLGRSSESDSGFVNYFDCVVIDETYIGVENGADVTPPTYSDVGSNSTSADYPCKFYTKWTDETGLATTGGWKLEHNNTGTLANTTWTAFTANPDWSNKTLTLNSTEKKIQWRFHANDTSDNWNSTTWQYITVTSKLSVGWNNFTVWTWDISKTLGAINSSLNSDSINWTVILIDYGNGTQWAMTRYWNGTDWIIPEYNSLKVVNSATDEWWLYCNEAGAWDHS